jgi:predicted amidophosphoribosyltransferase
MNVDPQVGIPLDAFAHKISVLICAVVCQYHLPLEGDVPEIVERPLQKDCSLKRGYNQGEEIRIVYFHCLLNVARVERTRRDVNEKESIRRHGDSSRRDQAAIASLFPDG